MKEIMDEKKTKQILMLSLQPDLNLGNFVKLSGFAFLFGEHESQYRFKLFPKFAMEYRLASVKVLQQYFSHKLYLGLPYLFHNQGTVPLFSSFATTGMHPFKKAFEYRGTGSHSSRKQDRKIFNRL